MSWIAAFVLMGALALPALAQEASVPTLTVSSHLVPEVSPEPYIALNLYVPPGHAACVEWSKDLTTWTVLGWWNDGNLQADRKVSHMMDESRIGTTTAYFRVRYWLPAEQGSRVGPLTVYERTVEPSSATAKATVVKSAKRRKT